MTRDEVIALAEQAGLWIPMADHEARVIRAVERFATLVAAAERQACAIMCEVHAATVMRPGSGSPWSACHECADAIRARGEK